MTWAQLLAAWELIEADLHAEYGVDIASGVLRKRTWRWLRLRIIALLAANTRTARHFAPKDQPKSR
ncbi:hypothetical protein RM780_04035 [Streptomyces sp. DSM 44917]|uniref:Transposase n=1 Tax=Streptomyces boetiae TaxID=3075541 RepID=A0ABU2L3P3_9ACTN|nr:hypothetical protein [Streptomyces sp. DSM 44917]MDT0306132.1 hypothetical protein [Streptomyces sp. DSM 44917]